MKFVNSHESTICRLTKYHAKIPDGFCLLFVQSVQVINHLKMLGGLRRSKITKKNNVTSTMRPRWSRAMKHVDIWTNMSDFRTSVMPPQCTLSAPHFTLYAPHNVHSPASTLHSTLFRVYTPRPPLYTLHLPQGTVSGHHFTLYAPHLRPPLYTLRPPQCTLSAPHSVHSPPPTLHSMPPKMYTLRPPLYILHFSECTLHGLHFTLFKNQTMYSLRPPLYTLRPPPPPPTVYTLRPPLYTLRPRQCTLSGPLYTLRLPECALHGPRNFNMELDSRSTSPGPPVLIFCSLLGVTACTPNLGLILIAVTNSLMVLFVPSGSKKLDNRKWIHDLNISWKTTDLDSSDGLM